jgi:peptide methionine sulfoxide reductase MsrB
VESQLTLDQYRVTRQHGTERAFSNPLNGEKRQDMFTRHVQLRVLRRAAVLIMNGTALAFDPAKGGK